MLTASQCAGDGWGEPPCGEQEGHIPSPKHEVKRLTDKEEQPPEIKGFILYQMAIPASSVDRV